MAGIPVLQPHSDLKYPEDPQPKADPIGEQLYQDSVPSTVQIRNKKGGGEGALGTGFFLDNDHVVTDAHVVFPSKELFVRTEDGKLLKAEIERIDDMHDLAVLKLDDPAPNAKPVSLGLASSLTAGDQVFAVSHPLGISTPYLSPGRFMRPSSGMETCQMTPGCTTNDIAPKDRPDTMQFLYQTKMMADLHIEHGSSGGPVFNRDGKLVGIVDLKLPDRSSPSWFSPAENVTSMMTLPPKFQFQYEWQPSPWVQRIKDQPGDGLFHAGLYAGFGYMGLRLVSKRPSAALIPAVAGSLLLTHDIEMYQNSVDWRDKLVYGIDTVADATIVAGSTATMFAPHDKKVYGVAAIAVGTLARAAAGLIPSHRTLVSTTRTDGDSRPPFIVG